MESSTVRYAKYNNR